MDRQADTQTQDKCSCLAAPSQLKMIDLVYFQYEDMMLSADNQDQEWTNTSRQHNNTMTLYKEVPVIRPSNFWAPAVILIVL